MDNIDNQNVENPPEVKVKKTRKPRAPKRFAVIPNKDIYCYCKTCKELKNLDNYSITRRDGIKDYYFRICKPCRSKIVLKSYTYKKKVKNDD